MTMAPPWLPSLVRLRAYGGDWNAYLAAVYHRFEQDFKDDPPHFRGLRVGLKRHPIVDGREAIFWHLVSEGSEEGERLPDLRRCERIRWLRAVIVHNEDEEVKVWENTRNRDRRICLWLRDQEYLVILARRSGYVLLWTAYCVTRAHRKRKLQREYEAWRKAEAAH